MTPPAAPDLLAVQRDDELIDLLAARRPVPRDNDVAWLLAALTAEVDDGLGIVVLPQQTVPAAASSPVAEPAAAPGLPATDDVARGSRRRWTAAGVAAAIVLGGTVSLSGVAAAVTGDPLAPYRAVGKALSLGSDDLPARAATIAHLNKRLSGARAALAHGDVAGVQAVIDDVTALLASSDLSEKQRAALQHRLDALRQAVARAGAADAERGRSEDRATAAATPEPGARGQQGPGDGQKERPARGANDGDDSASTASGARGAGGVGDPEDGGVTDDAAGAGGRAAQHPRSKPTAAPADETTEKPVEPAPEPGTTTGGGDQTDDQTGDPNGDGGTQDDSADQSPGQGAARR